MPAVTHRAEACKEVGREGEEERKRESEGGVVGGRAGVGERQGHRALVVAWGIGEVSPRCGQEWQRGGLRWRKSRAT